MRLAKNQAWRTKIVFVLLLLGVAVLPAGGCAVVGDLLDPGLAVALGLDPATIKPQQGVVIVAFDNTTRYPAQFFAFESLRADDLTQSSRNFSAEVPAGQVQNEVLDCPVGLIIPGSMGDNFAYDSTAVIVTGPDFAEIKPYNGPPLLSGSSYSCGDLVEIRLSPPPGGGEQGFVVTVRVIPGR
jgi:hypothetical protein